MTTRRRWTDETIAAELAPIVAELGRMPKREELAERGLSGLWSALQRNGGVSAWKDRMTAVEATGTTQEDAETSQDNGTSHDDIARRAYEIALESGSDDQVANWLAAERELTG